MAEITCPFVGLAPYTRQESRFFFGRESEVRAVIDHLKSAPLTLLCGASGVGKSSLLRAGVVPALLDGALLDDATAGGGPTTVVVYCDDWQGNALRRLREVVRRSFAEAASSGETESGPETRPGVEAASLADWLDALARRQGAIGHGVRLVILLDQFEEFFVYHGGQEKAVRNPLWRQLVEAVHRPDPPASFLVAIREDAMARLDCLEQLIPDPRSSCLRLLPLSEEALREAVVQPIRAHNASSPDDRRYGDIEIEPSFVDEVIAQLRRVRPSADNGDLRPAADYGDPQVSHDETPGVQLSALQRVMTTVWRHEVETGSRTLWTRTLGELGGAPAIVREHFDQAMAAFDDGEQETCARLFRFLVTPSGTKRAYSAVDLAGYADVPAEDLEALLARLTDTETRILTRLSPSDEADEVRYEISHDGLGPAVLHWQERYHENQARHEFAVKAQQQRTLLERERRAAGCLRWMLVSLAVVASAIVAAVLLAWFRIEEARRGAAGGEEHELRQLIEERDQALDEAAQLEERLNQERSRIPRLQRTIGSHTQQIELLERQRDGAYAEAAGLEEQLVQATRRADTVRRLLDNLRSAVGMEERSGEEPREVDEERSQPIAASADPLLEQLAAPETRPPEDGEPVAPSERRPIVSLEVAELREYVDRTPYGPFAGLARQRIRSSEGMALILKAVEHLGGGEVVDAVESIDSRAQGLYFGTEREGTGRLLVTSFDVLYLELEAGGTRSVRVVNHDEAFTTRDGFVQEAAPEEVRKQLMPLTENPFALLRRRADEGFFATAVERGEIAGQVVERVEVEVGGRMYRLGIDAETGRIRSLAFTGEDEDGNLGEYRKIYSDHRPSGGGVETPFKTVIYFDGDRVFDLAFEAIKLDGLLDEKPLAAIEQAWER